MSTIAEFKPTERDVEWAANFAALNTLLTHCASSERAALLLSTCRNAYLTANALFVDLQILMGDAVAVSPIRAGCELLAQAGTATKIRDYFGRAVQTVREYETKRDVWDNRASLMADIDKARSELQGVDPNRIELILSKTRVSGHGHGDGWDRELLALNLQDRPILNQHFAELDRIFAILKHAAQLGWNTSIAIDSNIDAQTELDLGGAGDALDRKKAIARVPELTAALAKACNWSIKNVRGNQTINFTTGYRRPQNIPLEKSLTLQDVSDANGLRLASQNLAKLIREALYFAHFELCGHFKPNVAKTPMPEPFVIDLPLPEPLFDTGRVAPPRLIHVRFAKPKATGDSVRIAIANLAVTLESGRHYRLSAPTVESVKKDVRIALQSAEDNGCNAVVFPEYSIPKSMAQEIGELADRHNVVVIAGLEGQWIEDKLCDQAVIAVPGEERVYYQSKQEPSLEEEAGGAFYRDGQLQLFTNSPIGEFSVILCSDLLQLTGLQAWTPDGPLPEILFVVARNKYPELYINIAKADCIRLYAAVIIANICENGSKLTNEGSCAVVPLRNDQLLAAKDAKAEGVFLKSLSLYDVSLHAIRARSRGKPDQRLFRRP